MIHRTWAVRVIAKQEPEHGYQITMREPPEFDYERPYWVNRTNDGGPIFLTVDKKEFDSIQVGDVLTISLTTGLP